MVTLYQRILDYMKGSVVWGYNLRFYEGMWGRVLVRGALES